MRYALLMLTMSTALFTGAAQAVECGDASPTALEGISLHESHEITRLESDEIKSLRNLLKRFAGKWDGAGQGIICLGEGSRSRERVTQYAIEAKGKGSANTGEWNLLLGHDRGTVTERLRLVLQDSTLGTSNSAGSKVEVLALGPNHVEWLYRYKGNQGRSPHEARWSVQMSNNKGRKGRSATIKHWVYSQGGLASKGSWTIAKK